MIAYQPHAGDLIQIKARTKGSSKLGEVSALSNEERQMLAREPAWSNSQQNQLALRERPWPYTRFVFGAVMFVAYAIATMAFAYPVVMYYVMQPD